MKRGDDEMEDQTVDVIDENSSIVTIKDKPSKLFFCNMYCYKILFVLVEGTCDCYHTIIWSSAVKEMVISHFSSCVSVN